MKLKKRETSIALNLSIRSFGFNQNTHAYLKVPSTICCTGGTMKLLICADLSSPIGPIHTSYVVLCCVLLCMYVSNIHVNQFTVVVYTSFQCCVMLKKALNTLLFLQDNIAPRKACNSHSQTEGKKWKNNTMQHSARQQTGCGNINALNSMDSL